MSAHDPVAYTYDADIHCPDCALARFGRCADGFIACAEHGAADSEGNGPGAVAPYDAMPCHSVCGACAWPLDGAECMTGQGTAGESKCCADSCPPGECPDCDRCPRPWRVAARDALADRYGTLERSRLARATYHGRLWHQLTGRTSPENGQQGMML